MSETDLGALPTSKRELAVTIINGSRKYAKSPVLVRRLPHLHLLPKLQLIFNVRNNSSQLLISLYI